MQMGFLLASETPSARERQQPAQRTWKVKVRGLVSAPQLLGQTRSRLGLIQALLLTQRPLSPQMMAMQLAHSGSSRQGWRQRCCYRPAQGPRVRPRPQLLPRRTALKWQHSGCLQRQKAQRKQDLAKLRHQVQPSRRHHHSIRPLPLLQGPVKETAISSSDAACESAWAMPHLLRLLSAEGLG